MCYLQQNAFRTFIQGGKLGQAIICKPCFEIAKKVKPIIHNCHVKQYEIVLKT